jgi:hypothetical protein
MSKNKMENRTNYDLKKDTQKIRNWAPWTHLKTEDELRFITIDTSLVTVKRHEYHRNHVGHIK